MAISATHYHLLRELAYRKVLKGGVHLLEIGEANFYGDMDPAEILSDIRKIPSPQRAGKLATQFSRIFDTPAPDQFALARLIYEVMFAPLSITAIDAGGPTASHFDLNQPVKLPHKFDTSINHGTAEHIFNIAQVFRTMHDWTKPGGLMIHESPFTGWVDHGFYCLQPTLFWDVATANGYEIVGAWVEHLASKTVIAFETREQILELARRDQLPNNAMLFVVLRKAAEESAFRVPMQGVYAGSVSQQTRDAWRDLR